MTDRKLEMERAAQSTKAKLPRLKITPFEGTSTDWIRFENMFLTQVDRQPISDEEKFGYLLEMVSPKVRSKYPILSQVLKATNEHGTYLRMSMGRPK